MIINNGVFSHPELGNHDCFSLWNQNLESPNFSEFEHSQQFPGWKWKPSSRCHTKQGVNFPLLTTNYTYCILFNCRVQMWVLETLFGITGPPTGTTVGCVDLSSDLNTSSPWILLVGQSQTMKYIYSADTQLTCQALILKHYCSPWGWTSWMWPCQTQWQVWFQNTEKKYTGATSVNLLKCRWEHEKYFKDVQCVECLTIFFE